MSHSSTIHTKIAFERSWTNGNGITMSYYISRDHDIVAILLQKDCETPITDTTIIRQNYTYSMNENHDYYILRYDLDPTTIRESSIFNTFSSTIEICHEVRSTNDTYVFDRQIITIAVPRAGKFCVPTPLKDFIPNCNFEDILTTNQFSI